MGRAAAAWCVCVCVCACARACRTAAWRSSRRSAHSKVHVGHPMPCRHKPLSHSRTHPSHLPFNPPLPLPETPPPPPTQCMPKPTPACSTGSLAYRMLMD
jgi:hypothetical protein